MRSANKTLNLTANYRANLAALTARQVSLSVGSEPQVREYLSSPPAQLKSSA
jgi:hypothetical protein